MPIIRKIRADPGPGSLFSSGPLLTFHGKTPKFALFPTVFIRVICYYPKTIALLTTPPWVGQAIYMNGRTLFNTKVPNRTRYLRGYFPEHTQNHCFFRCHATDVTPDQPQATHW